MRSIYFLAVVWALSACAPAPRPSAPTEASILDPRFQAVGKPVSEEAARQAINRVVDCFFAKDASLDDGVSDAGTIATALVGACSAEISSADHITTQGLPINAINETLRDSDQTWRTPATNVVLQMRVKRNKAH